MIHCGRRIVDEKEGRLENEGEQWISVDEAARRHQCRPKVIYTAIDRGTLSARIVHQTASRRYWEVREADFEEWSRRARASGRGMHMKARMKRAIEEQISRRGADTVAA
jgi:hypothetical protein